MLERKEEIKSLESREFYNSHRFYGSNFVITFYLLSSFLSRLLPTPFGLLDVLPPKESVPLPPPSRSLMAESWEEESPGICLGR